MFQWPSAAKSEEIHQFIYQVGNIEAKSKATELYVNIYIVSTLEPWKYLMCIHGCNNVFKFFPSFIPIPAVKIITEFTSMS